MRTSQFPFPALVAWAIISCSGGSSDQPRAQPRLDPASAAQVKNDPADVLTDSILRLADGSRIAGSSDAPIWFVIMSDFQCSFCRQFHVETYPRIRRDYVDRGLVRLAYVNSVGPSHVHAATTAEYAFCAGAQGKFWEYHDALFRTYDTWTRQARGTKYFDQLAAEVKLDSNRLQGCLSSHVMQRLVAADDLRSDQVGVTGTPSFLIDGRLVIGLQPYDVLKRRLDAAIAAAGSKSGNPAPNAGGGSQQP
jgi:protein-disulfide isomerase